MEAATPRQRILAALERVEAALSLDPAARERVGAVLRLDPAALERVAAALSLDPAALDRVTAALRLDHLLDGRSHSGGDAFAERPEVYVGAAFGGGLALAIVLRALGPT